MSLTRPFRCDVCGKQKGSTNRWWMIVSRESLNLAPFDDLIAEEDGVKHLCGESCVSKAVSSWMAEQKGH
jgi:hypothetical protein